MATKKSTNNLIYLKAEEMAEKIIKVIVIEMLDSGLTPTEIARRSGAPASTITRILHKQRGKDPSLITLLRIYFSLDIPLQRFLNRLFS